MNRSVAERTQDALQLPQSEQFKLARVLLENSQFQNDPGADKAWNEEIERRIEAIDTGVAKGRSFAEALRDLDKRLQIS